MTDQPISLGNNLTASGRVAVGGVVFAGTSVALRASITASGGVANGLFNFTTLVAAANSDALTASRIDPTFTPASFTGLTARGLQISAFSNATFTTPGDIIGIDVGVVTGAGTNAYGLKITAPVGATNNYGLYNDGKTTLVDAATLSGTTNTIGTAGSSNGLGLRIGSSRIVEANKPTAPVDIAGGITATVTQILEAGIFLCSASATLTLPTMAGASGLVQALPGTPAVGDIISFYQVVAAAQTATLAVGTGSTLGGIATTAAATTGRKWIGRITSVTANSETVTWY